MDLTKLSLGDKVMAGSGLALFVFSFLNWFKIEQDFGFGVVAKASQNGWDYFFTGILPVLLGLALVGYVVVTKVLDGVELPDLPVAWPLAVLGTAGLAALLVIMRLLIGSDPDGLDRSIGLFLAVLAVLGLAGGAFLKFQEDGGELPTKGGGMNQGGSSDTPPSPF